MSHQNSTQNFARNPKIMFKNFYKWKLQNFLSFLSYKEIFEIFDFGIWKYIKPLFLFTQYGFNVVSHEIPNFAIFCQFLDIWTT